MGTEPEEKRVEIPVKPAASTKLIKMAAEMFMTEQAEMLIANGADNAHTIGTEFRTNIEGDPVKITLLIEAL